jgi:hypothetical protein
MPTFLLAGCYAPALRSEAEKFFIEPEILETVRPYLETWSSLPPEETQSDRELIGNQLGRSIDAYVESSASLADEPFIVIVIPIEHWHDWERGMLYIPLDEEFGHWGGKELRQIEQHIYAYNVSY